MSLHEWWSAATYILHFYVLQYLPLISDKSNLDPRLFELEMQEKCTSGDFMTSVKSTSGICMMLEYEC